MIVILGGIAGGLGFFFMGVKLLTDRLKSLANRRLRMSAARWTRNRWTGCAWGAVVGAITQTMPAMTFVTVGMLRSGMLSQRRALPMLLGGNAGAPLLLLVAMLDVKLIALYVLGVSQIAAMIAPKGHGRARLQAMAVALFGMSMMMFGSLMLKEAVAPLADLVWFKETVALAASSEVLCLAAGILLSVIVQSTTMVMVSAISLAAAGIVGIEGVLLFFFGASLGSSLSLYLMGLGLTGHARQVTMYQVLYNGVACAIFVPLVWIEAQFGVPLFASAILAVDLPLAQSVAFFCILTQLVTSLFQLATLGPFARRIERWWPTTQAEALSKPRFIHDGALEDAGDALSLADREQRRLLEILSCCLDTVRRGTDVGALRDTAKDVLQRIQEFLEDLAADYPDEGVDQHISVLTRQRVLCWLDERVLELCEALRTMPRNSDLDEWRTGLIEGVDTVLLVLHDMLSADENDESWQFTAQLTSSRSDLMSKTRNAYLGDESTLSTAERASVLRITSVAEHIFLLLSKLTDEYRNQSPQPVAPVAVSA